MFSQWWFLQVREGEDGTNPCHIALMQLAFKGIKVNLLAFQ